METKHTKGEWMVDVVNKNQVICNGIKIANIMGVPIKANAKLIAAAPDLLDEHIMNLTRLNQLRKMNLGSYAIAYIDLMIDSTKKAIKKATE